MCNATVPTQYDFLRFMISISILALKCESAQLTALEMRLQRKKKNANII